VAASEQKAYEAIRRGISAGVYPSGGHLRAGDLATQLGISRTPVREALRRLHAEGMVDFFANRGAFVAGSSPQDVDEVFDLRVVLESHAAELSARRFTDVQIADLAVWTDEMERCATAPARDSAGLTRANDAFHAAIISAAANRRLSAMIASVVELSWVARTFSTYSDADLAASLAHHREMIRAFTVRDGVWAAAVMRGHIRSAYHVFASSDAARSTHERTGQELNDPTALPAPRPDRRRG
jgi:DNA-binding GntR family transcriptional regulator